MFLIITNKDKKGFTFIEMLLGLSIFALVAASVSTTLWGGIRLSNRLEPQNNVYREAQSTMELMVKEIENMVFYDFSGSYPDRSSFVHNGNRVTFLLDSEEGIKAVSYYLDSPEQSRIHKIIVGNVHSKNVSVTNRNSQAEAVQFLMREELLLVDYLSNNTSDVAPQVINVHAKEGGLRFYYQYITDEEGRTRLWESSWQEENSIPASVRVELDVVSPDEDSGVITFSRDVFIPTGIFPQKRI